MMMMLLVVLLLMMMMMNLMCIYTYIHPSHHFLPYTHTH